jgi:hypothetical protein
VDALSGLTAGERGLLQKRPLLNAQDTGSTAATTLREATLSPSWAPLIQVAGDMTKASVDGRAIFLSESQSGYWLAVNPTGSRHNVAFPRVRVPTAGSPVLTPRRVRHDDGGFVTDDSSSEVPAAASTCAFPMILHLPLQLRITLA